MALVEGFRACQSANERAERRGQEKGITRYRRMLEQVNRDRLLVLIGTQYVLLRSYESAQYPYNEGRRLWCAAVDQRSGHPDDVPRRTARGRLQTPLRPHALAFVAALRETLAYRHATPICLGSLDRAHGLL
jgi:hypothetical protein